jgi:L-ascorbate metabolism protein UlaG (beta-lactamase superfamily)
VSGAGIGFTYVGGPTLLIELGGLRLLTDPTFDAAGAEIRNGAYVLHKNAGPAVAAAEIGPIDVVLLSHDHHFDNLDQSGRDLLAGAGLVLTTQAGAGRLGRNAEGLTPWQTFRIPLADGRTLEITATPARHGPADGDRGPVIGFILAVSGGQEPVVYLSGDTVWYEGVTEVARKFQVAIAVPFMGAARVAAVGPAHLTMTAVEGVELARAMPKALILPLHFEGWDHFSEGHREIQAAFDGAGLAARLRWLSPGRREGL